MSQKYNLKMNLDLTGTAFTDESHDSVGAAVFTIDHDFFINDTGSGDVLVIRDAAAGGGNLLVQDVDYSLSGKDDILSDEDHVDKDVYSQITIINAAYQACTLYFSGKYVADSIDENDVSQVTKQYSAVSASASLSPDSYMCYGCTAGVNGIKLVLPTATEYIKNIILDFIKMDDTDSAVMIDGYSAETINGLASVYLIEQYQKLSLMCTGTGWVIISGTLIADSGWINTSDWTSREFGTVDVDYDNLVGAFQLGETVTESGGETGIVVADTGSTLTLWKVTDTGVFTNNNTLAGNLSGATADVDEAGTGSTKNLDSNFYHGFGKNLGMLNIKLFKNATATYTGAFQFGYASSSATSYGQNPIQVDVNNFKWQTSSAGSVTVNDDGSFDALTNDDIYYRIVVTLTI